MIRFAFLVPLAVSLTTCLTTCNRSVSQTVSPKSEKAWSRTPKEIVFQNDSHWSDNRWQQTDLGPFLAASHLIGHDPTLKGIAIRVGDKGQAAVCFDTARLRMSAGWTGDFLRFDPGRFGLIRPPQAGGQPVFITPKLAGWAKQGRFHPTPQEITLHEVERDYTSPGSSVTSLPRDWAAYRGMYLSGKRVVLSYTVGNTDVLESPWYVEANGAAAFVRSMEVSPSNERLQMLLGQSDSDIAVIGSDAARIETTNGIQVMTLTPRPTVVRVKIVVFKKSYPEESRRALIVKAGKPESLATQIQNDAGRFPQVITTVGSTSESNRPYVIDTLTLPFENPWNALLFTSGHDFFSDGRAAICTVHGDVWTVDGIDRDLSPLRWRRFATGLFQPLGLKVVDDKVYVVGRDQITRLHDRNGDGEADYYENFNNQLFVTPRTHDFVTCLDTDPDGNFYFIHAKTGVMRVSADGSSMDSIADGFRNPNGMAVGPDGTITASPQEGNWTPQSSLIVVQPGRYYGYGGPRISEQRPLGWDPPMCFVPKSMDNSGGGQVWVEGDRWGPFRGKLLHLSYGQCRLLLALPEKVGGVFQGGTIQFPTDPSDFEAGIMRGRFHPHDGQLYVSGLRGWQTRAIRDGCFQRVRYTGGAVNLPIRVKTYTNGLKLTFTEELDRETAQNLENYFASQWNYRWTENYGSPDYSVANPQREGRDDVPIVSATLMDDGHAVFLEMPNRQPVHQLSIDWMLQSARGHSFHGTYVHTINSTPHATMSESKIVRRVQDPLIASEIVQRLKPELRLRFQTVDGGTDVRTSRLAVLWQRIDQSPTPFLATGPFQAEMDGTLKIALSGNYDFRIESNGRARLWINDEKVANHADAGEVGQKSLSVATGETVRLRKGHNRIRVQYESPTTGVANLRVMWKGYNFDWEPIPPDVLYHDSGSQGLTEGRRRRLGRTLFANRRCIACHASDVGRQPMFELTLAAPNLEGLGDRWNDAWLMQWLVAPQKLSSHPRMPAMLGNGKGTLQTAADIAAFLTQSTRQNQRDPRARQQLDEVRSGERHFESLGCLACHHFESPSVTDGFQRVSLYYANVKYQPGKLAEFLKSPSAHHPASNMPDFQLSDKEAIGLAAYVRSMSLGKITDRFPEGDVQRGQKSYQQAGCFRCHESHRSEKVPPKRSWDDSIEMRACLESPSSTSRRVGLPEYAFTEEQRDALWRFINHDRSSLRRSHDRETSARLVSRLRCGACHDRDGAVSPRRRVIALEGSGRVPDVIPSLTWAGEKFRPPWTERLLQGNLGYRSRPWLKARMPAFKSYATKIAHGLAVEHGVNPYESTDHRFKQELADIGHKLSLQSGLDCRQCHAIANLQPRGDKNTQIALGVNLAYVRDRLRYESYQRFMLNPSRYDRNTKMIRLSENGITTKLRRYFDADAKKQFDAVWHYIQSLTPPVATMDLQD